MVLLHRDLRRLFEVVLLLLSATAVRLAGAACPRVFWMARAGALGVCAAHQRTRDRCVPSAKIQKPKNSEISKSSPKPRKSVPAVLFSLKNHPGNCSQMGNLNWARGALIRRRAEIKAPCLCFLRKHSNCHATAAGAVDEEGDLKKSARCIPNTHRTYPRRNPAGNSDFST